MNDTDEKSRQDKTQIKLMLHTGEEHNLHIRGEINDPSDLMYPAYQAALVSLKEILQNSLKWITANVGRGRGLYRLDESHKCGEFDVSLRNRELYEYSNNILAFCADRGQGKTSAMLSFAEALRLHSSLGKPIGGLEGSSFYILPPIDPTLLSKEDSVAEITLSRLYHEFNSRLKSGESVGNSLSGIEKAEILQNFQNCLYGLRAARHQGNPQDDFEALSQLGDCFEVKNLLSKILSSFFKFIGMPDRYSYLVVLLDDTDLQFHHAYESLEETRKYLSLPNIVILMATDLDQLRKLVIDHYLTTLTHAMSKNVFSDADIRRMAVKYLDKLIPASQAIYLPTVKVQCEAHETIMLDFGDGECHELQTAIFQLIRQKTGIVFAPQNGSLHKLIPTTLRGLRQLYRLLDQMEDCGSEVSLPLTTPENEVAAVQDRNTFYRQKLNWLSRRKSNLALFEDYFLNDWCSSKLTESDWNILKNIHQVSSTKAITQAVKMLRKKVEQMNREKGALNSRAKKKPTPNSNKYSDMLALLSVLQTEAVIAEESYFVYAIHIYFTIHFHKLALKGWQDSLYCWADGGRKKSFQIHLKGLYEQFYGGLFAPDTKKTMAMAAKLAARLSWVFTASMEFVEWGEEARMLQVLDYAVLMCCNWDIQELTQTYVEAKPEPELTGNIQDVIGEYLRPFNNWLETECHIEIPYKNFFQLLSAANRAEFINHPDLSGPKQLMKLQLLQDLDSAIKNLLNAPTGDKQAGALEKMFETAIAAIERLQENGDVQEQAAKWLTTFQMEKVKFVNMPHPEVDTAVMKKLEEEVGLAISERK